MLRYRYRRMPPARAHAPRDGRRPGPGWEVLAPRLFTICQYLAEDIPRGFPAILQVLVRRCRARARILILTVLSRIYILSRSSAAGTSH